MKSIVGSQPASSAVPFSLCFNSIYDDHFVFVRGRPLDSAWGFRGQSAMELMDQASVQDGFFFYLIKLDE